MTTDPADEYEALAEECARRGLPRHFAGSIALREIPMSPEVAEEIECSPDLFERRVADYAYGIAMEGAAS